MLMQRVIQQSGSSFADGWQRLHRHAAAGDVTGVRGFDQQGVLSPHRSQHMRRTHEASTPSPDRPVGTLGLAWLGLAWLGLARPSPRIAAPELVALRRNSLRGGYGGPSPRMTTS